MVPLAPLLYDPAGQPVKSGQEAAPTETDDGFDGEPEDYGKQPQRRLSQELPVYGVPSPDRVWVVEGILQQLENGQFHDAAWLWDAMKRDARVRGVMRTRAQGLLGSGIECDIESDNAHGNSTGKRSQTIAQELFHGWARMHDSSSLARAADYAIGLGACAVEKLYTRGDRWNYRLKVWHPQYLTWDWLRRTYRLTTTNGQIYLPRPEHYGIGVPQDDDVEWGHPSQWMVLCPYGFDYAFLEGLVRALAAPWLARNWDQNDWARYNEIHGRPIRIAIAPETAKEANKRAFFQSVGNLNGETVIRALRDKDGNLYDVKLLEAVADTFKTFQQKIDWADKTIAVLVLGQSTSTDGSKGLGSDANPGDSVRVDVKKFDNTWLSQHLYEEGIREWAAFNWGDADLAPAPPADDKRSGYWQVEPAADSAKRAKEFSDFATGFATLKNATSALDERALLDEYGYPMISEEEQQQAELDAQKKQQDADAAAHQRQIELMQTKQPAPPQEP